MLRYTTLHFMYYTTLLVTTLCYLTIICGHCDKWGYNNVLNFQNVRPCSVVDGPRRFHRVHCFLLQGWRVLWCWRQRLDTRKDFEQSHGEKFNNWKLHNLYSSASNFRTVNSRRIRLAGHVTQVKERWKCAHNFRPQTWTWMTTGNLEHRLE